MDKRIESIEHEEGSGWWIYLKPGWIVSDERTHAIVEDRKRDALDGMYRVVPCKCKECLDMIRAAAKK